MSKIHPLAAPDHLPGFITGPGSSDLLFIVVGFIVVAVVLAIGVMFFWLHALPERMVHNATRLQVDLVAILCLLSLFTHIHGFWVAGLLIALVPMPSIKHFGVTDPLRRIASSLETLALEVGQERRARSESAVEPLGNGPPSKVQPLQALDGTGRTGHA